MAYRPKIKPCGTAKIGTGIYLSWNYGVYSKNIFVNAKMQVSGPAASQYIANQMKIGIETCWTKLFRDGFSIRSEVDMLYREDHRRFQPETILYVQEANRIQIIITYDPGPSYVQVLKREDINGICVRFHINNEYDTHKIPGRIAHEFGHLLSLDDQYVEFGKGNEPRFTKAKPGWENNIMGNIDGILESRNVEEIFKSHCTVNDDDDF